MPRHADCELKWQRTRFYREWRVAAPGLVALPCSVCKGVWAVLPASHPALIPLPGE
jgi:hypothetical protein